MKYIFSILLILSFNISFSQMTVSEMIKVYNMDLDQFETYAISKGYEFNKLQNDENYYGHSYSKGYRENTKYLTLYTSFFLRGKELTYQTANSNEYINFKNQMKNLGFVLYSEKTFEGSPNRVYRNKTYEISIYTIEGGDFEISIYKY